MFTRIPLRDFGAWSRTECVAFIILSARATYSPTSTSTASATIGASTCSPCLLASCTKSRSAMPSCVNRRPFPSLSDSVSVATEEQHIIHGAMYFEMLTSMVARLHAAMEDLWVEGTCCRNVILDNALMTESELDAALADAKKNPAIRQRVQEHFAESRKKIDELAKQTAYEFHLS